MNPSADMPFPFMRLPPELRSEVYSHLYIVRFPRIIPRAVQVKISGIAGRWTTHVAPTSLLRTSRIIRSEVEDGVRRVNLHCTPILVGQSADAPFFNILLHSLKSAHDRDRDWLRNIGSSTSNSKHEINDAMLKDAAEDLALKLNRQFTRHRHSEVHIESRHILAFTKWALLRLRQTYSISVLFRVHVKISQPRSALSGDNFDIWSSAALLKNAERAGLSVTNHVKILTARHIERAVLEDKLGAWKSRLDELGVTWEVALNDEALERLFPSSFSRRRIVDQRKAA